MRHLAMILLLVAAPALAGDLVMKGRNGAVLRLTDAPCTHPATLETIRDEYRPQFKAASGISRGRAFQACWMEHEGHALVMFEDGSDGVFELAAFSDPSV